MKQLNEAKLAVSAASVTYAVRRQQVRKGFWARVFTKQVTR
jgi:hypothetical protein